MRFQFEVEITGDRANILANALGFETMIRNGFADTVRAARAKFGGDCAAVSLRQVAARDVPEAHGDTIVAMKRTCKLCEGAIERDEPSEPLGRGAHTRCVDEMLETFNEKGE